MIKRDIIEEIKSIKSRSEFNSRYDYNSRLSEIEYALKEFNSYNGSFNEELLKYIPISTVACFEAFFSSTIKEIIDFGKPYSNNIAKFNQSKNIKLDFEVVAAIQTKTLTVGEFVAHMLPYNNLNDLNSNITTLIEKDFLSELKSFNKKPILGYATTISEAFKKEAGEILESVKQTYEMRHIFCHEFATNFRVEQATILKNFNNCKIFLEQTNDFIWDLLYPNSPKTQLEMNAQTVEEFEKTEKELSELIEKIKTASDQEYTVGNFDNKIFDQAMTHWKEYRQFHAEYKANTVKGGSMYPSIYSSNLTYLTREKINGLEDEFQILLRKTRL